jgi:endonuclease/exonuclease/phosphatase (EEP) superfamily protein YafD
MRRREVDLITQAASRSPNPVILAGDFNQLPRGRTYAAITKHFTDALAHLHKTHSTVRAGIFRARIDYIFLSRRHWRPIAANVGSPKPSDHRPLWLDVVLLP